MNKKAITVTLPLEEFERLAAISEVESVNQDVDMLRHHNECKYISKLVDDYVRGEIHHSEVMDFEFFKTKPGKFILSKIMDYAEFDVSPPKGARRG